MSHLDYVDTAESELCVEDHVDYWEKAYEKLGQTNNAIDRFFDTISQESRAFIERLARQDLDIEAKAAARKLSKMDLDIEQQVTIWELSLDHKVWKFYKKHQKVDDRTKVILREVARTISDEDESTVPRHMKLLRICKKRQNDSQADKTKIEFLDYKFTLDELWKKAIDVLEKSKAIGDAATSSNPTASLAWSIFKIILEVPIKDAKQTGAMLIGIEKTLIVMNRASLHEQRVRSIRKERPSECEDIEESLVAIYCRLLGFLASTSLLQSMNLFRRLWQAIWRADDIISFEKDILELEMEFERHARAFDGIMTRNSLDTMNREIRKLQSDIDKYYLNESREKVLAWLSDAPYLGYHRNAKQGRVKNTGKWVFERHEYKSWEAPDGPRFLWISGIPGAGKTTLITSIVDRHRRNLRKFHIWRLSTSEEEFDDDDWSNDESVDDASAGDGSFHEPADGSLSDSDSADNISTEDAEANDSDFESSRKTQLAYFYCRKGVESRTSSRSVLGSLIRQLADSYYPLPQQLLRMYEKKGQLTSKSRNITEDQYLELLKCVMPSDTETILVVDALDECERKEDEMERDDRRRPSEELRTLLSVFKKLLGSNHQLKIVISSQANVTISSHLDAQTLTLSTAGAKALKLGISAADNQDDISKLARTRIREERESEEGKARMVPLVSDELEEEIERVFAEKCGGMFQWADYHINYLLSLDSGRDISEALPGLPMKLEEAYEKTFKSIDNDRTPQKEVALRVIQWLLADGGSSKKRVILGAVSQRLKDNKVVEQAYDQNAVIKACRNLVATEADDFHFSHLPVIDSGVRLPKSDSETTLLDFWNYGYENWYRHFGLSTKHQQEDLKTLLKDFIGENDPPIGCSHWLS
ncbi:hypothetical protein NKR23_g1474 [Pleurostoma richardsiae]|uniref:Uncharacterized protein n=1 Tax=Pleurostoma richardsiae TaxID=41990 RepID=A0AA38RPY6_9PEZI|nr:hypothetical protein NKR23_g1474 [Pleurostoma richardsiae]